MILANLKNVCHDIALVCKKIKVKENCFKMLYFVEIMYLMIKFGVLCSNFTMIAFTISKIFVIDLWDSPHIYFRTCFVKIKKKKKPDNVDQKSECLLSTF